MTSYQNYILDEQLKNNKKSVWQDLQNEKEFGDVIIACDENQILAHQIVIASSSPLFKNILKQISNQNPLIYLSGVRFKYLQYLIDFIYQGIAKVAIDDLKIFLEIAEDLEIRGLSDKSYTSYNAQPKSHKNPSRKFKNEHEKESFEEGSSEDALLEASSINQEKLLASIPTPFAIVDENTDETETESEQPVVKYKKPKPNDKQICPTCGITVAWRNFKYHTVKHDPTANIKHLQKFHCELCGKRFRWGHLQKSHMCEKVSSYFIDNEERIICTLCLYVFSDLKEVIPHKEKNHLEAYKKNPGLNNLPIFECPADDCNETFRKIKDVKRHLQYLHFRVAKYMCPECDEKFTISYSMKKHRQDVHGLGNDLQCESCEENFFLQSRLKEHVYIKHSDEKREVCPECPKRFKMKNHLKRHMFIHTQKSKFECEECGKKFRDKATLGYHMNIHNGEKPHLCPYCPYSAASYPVLHIHKIRCPQSTAARHVSIQ